MLEKKEITAPHALGLTGQRIQPDVAPPEVKRTITF
jgi:hypothetical protein